MGTSVQTIILAAGRSSRFNTDTSKLLYTLCGQPMLVNVIKALQPLSLPIILVVGHQRDQIMSMASSASCDTLTFVTQEEQCGTGHAVFCTKDQWHADTILIMNGDMPLITTNTIQSILTQHQQSRTQLTIVGAHYNQPHQYGRIISNKKNIEIIEARDFTADPSAHTLINAGIYCIQRSLLAKALDVIMAKKNTHELYLTDIVAHASKEHCAINVVTVEYEHVRGVNTLQELYDAENIKRTHIIEQWMQHGVRFMMPHTTHIDHDVTIGANSVIGAGVQLTRGTHIGSHTHIEPYSILDHAIVRDHVIIKSHSVIQDSVINSHAIIGPFAHLRNSSTIGEHTAIGNFVEVSKSSIGAETKAKHLSYIGNALIGNHVNIGAGTIFCNYNGFTKETTIVEDHAYIGANNSLVAPLTIGKQSITAAGSCITDHVPANALAIARSRQILKDGYAAILRARHQNSQSITIQPATKVERNFDE